MANDVDTLLKILSPDYTLTSIDKETLTYGVYKAYLLLKAKGPKDTTRYSTFIRKLTEKNGDAEVDSVETMITRKADKTGRSVLTTHRHVYSDKWRLSGGEWLLYRTVTLKESTRIDR